MRHRPSPRHQVFAAAAARLLPPFGMVAVVVWLWQYLIHRAITHALAVLAARGF